MTTPNGNGWKRFWLGLLIPLAAFLVGYGALQARVSGLEVQVNTKASQETIAAQNAEILRRLDRIERKIDERSP